jgi:hypothetical protein
MATQGGIKKYQPGAAPGAPPTSEFDRYMEKYGVAPSSPEAQRNLETVGHVAENIPPIIPAVGPAGGVSAGLSRVGVRRAAETVQESVGNMTKALSGISETPVAGVKQAPPGFRTTAERGVAAVPVLTQQEKLDLPRMQGVVNAQNNNYQLTPKAAEAGGFSGNAAKGMAKVAGNAQTAKEMSAHNAENTARLARESVGLEADVPITHDALAKIRTEEGQKYAVLKDQGTLKHDPQFDKDLTGIVGEIKSAAEDYPALLDNPIIKRVEDLRNPEVKFSSAVEVVKDLRNEADKAFRAGDKKLGRAYRDSAMAVDNSMDRALTASVKADPAKAKMVDDYRAARVRIAKTYMLDDAIAGNKPGEVNALVYGRALKKGVPLEGPARAIADFAQQFGEEGIAQKLGRSEPKGLPSFGDLLLSALFHPGRVLTNVATLGMRPAMRAALQTETGQKIVGARARGAVSKAEAAAGPAPLPEPAGPLPGASVVKPNPLRGPLGDVVPDWETIPGAGGAGAPPIARSTELPAGRTVIDAETGGPLKNPVVGEDNFPANVQRAAGSEIPAAPGRPGDTDVGLTKPAGPGGAFAMKGTAGEADAMLVGSPPSRFGIARTDADVAAMLDPGAVEARRQMRGGDFGGDGGPPSGGPGGAPPPPAPPAIDPRLAEVARLRAEATSDIVKKTLDEHAKRLKKTIAAEEAVGARMKEIDDLEAAVHQTTDPSLQAILAAKANKLRTEKIPAGEMTEGAPEIKTKIPEKIPVGEVTEGAPEIKAKTPEKIPVGEAKEIYVDPASPEAAAWRKAFGLGAEDAARAFQLRKAFDANPTAVQTAIKEHDDHPSVAFNKAIDEIVTTEATKEAENAAQAQRTAQSSESTAVSGNGNESTASGGNTSARAVESGTVSDAAPGTNAKQAAAGEPGASANQTAAGETAGETAGKNVIKVAKYDDGYVVEDQHLTEIAGPFKSRGDAEQARLKLLASNPDELQSISKAAALDAELRDTAARLAATPDAVPRGIKAARKTLDKALADNVIDRDGHALAQWLLDHNPALASNMQLMLGGNRPGAQGGYNQVRRLVVLYDEAKNDPLTAVHEILHHTERFMSPEIQRGIRREWEKGLEAARVLATPEERAALADIEPALAFGKGSESADKARARLIEAFQTKKLDEEKFYPLVSPSEFFAVHGSRILNERFQNRGSWRQQAKEWLRKLTAHMRDVLGIRADSPVLKALDDVLNPTTSEEKSKLMLHQEATLPRSETTAKGQP